ncbi:MAG TPA: hypothetical protein VMH89_14285 [Candidatus Acidoferrum sp.]|nr:hypothetical protein [Candidatus Acidoferrum sp.]
MASGIWRSLVGGIAALVMTAGPFAQTPASGQNPPASSQTAPAAADGKHRISFTFDYDFRNTPACTKKTATHCVKRFVLYDLSAGIEKKTTLGTAPLPEHPKGLMHVSATTDPILFDPGRHLIAVSAEMDDGTQSDPRRCTTIVKVP